MRIRIATAILGVPFYVVILVFGPMTIKYINGYHAFCCTDCIRPLDNWFLSLFGAVYALWFASHWWNSARTDHALKLTALVFAVYAFSPLLPWLWFPPHEVATFGANFHALVGALALPLIVASIWRHHVSLPTLALCGVLGLGVVFTGVSLLGKTTPKSVYLDHDACGLKGI